MAKWPVDPSIWTSSSHQPSPVVTTCHAWSLQLCVAWSRRSPLCFRLSRCVSFGRSERSRFEGRGTHLRQKVTKRPGVSPMKNAEAPQSTRTEATNPSPYLQLSALALVPVMSCGHLACCFLPMECIAEASIQQPSFC